MRGVALISPQAPDLAQAVYHAGPGESLRRLSVWLARSRTQKANAAGVRIPMAAAEMFTGMTMGHGYLRGILGVDEPEPSIRAAAPTRPPNGSSGLSRPDPPGVRTALKSRATA